MAFSFGRRFGSFLGDVTPAMFKQGLGPITAPTEPVSILQERAMPRPADPQLTSYGAGLRAVPTQRSAYETAAPAPDFNPTLIPMPTYKPSQTFSEYWNTPSEGSGRSRAQQLFDVGSMLRDDYQGGPGPAAMDWLSKPSFEASRGGGVGGVGGRKNRRSGP